MFEFYKNALQGAITNPLCGEYKNVWRMCGDDKERLAMLALRQQSLPYLITHCYKGKGLTKEYILDAFGDYINARRPILDADLVKGYSYAIYVDFKAICNVTNDVTAFMWCSCPQVEIGTSKCPVLYVGCGSELHLVCDGYNSPVIYLFDDSSLVIDDADDTSSIRVYKYSSDAQVEYGKYCTCDNIRVFEKELRL